MSHYPHYQNFDRALQQEPGQPKALARSSHSPPDAIAEATDEKGLQLGKKGVTPAPENAQGNRCNFCMQMISSPTISSVVNSREWLD